METKHKKALIIGGGIAGPMVAMFLQKAGISSEICEARSQAGTYAGIFLNLAGNGLNLLQTLGVDAPVTAVGSAVPRMIMWNGKGKRLGEVRNGARRGLTTSVTLRRGDLQQVLHEAVIARGIPIHFNKKLCGIEDSDEGSVRALFADGTAAAADLLIGCDGVHSCTRRLINPAAPTPTYTGLVSTGGFTTQPDLPPTPETQHFFFGRQAFFGYHVRASGEIYWFNNHERSQEPARDELKSITNQAWQRQLLALHREDLPVIRQIIRSTQDGIMGYPIYDIPTQPLWHKGRVVLVGDAVHAVSPSSGQGASLAMEDAGVLAKCLRDIPDLQRAFAAYEQRRRQRVERIVQWARKLGDNKTAVNPMQAWFRDLFMPFFLKFSASPARLDWIYDFHLDWEQSVNGMRVVPDSAQDIL